MTIIHRLFAWGLAAAIAFATLGPAERRPHSTLGQNGEHALAFVLLGLAFGLAHTRNRLHTAAFVVAFTGLIELLQFLAMRGWKTLWSTRWRHPSGLRPLRRSAGRSGGHSGRCHSVLIKSSRGNDPARIAWQLLRALVEDPDDLARARLHDHAAIIDHRITVFSVLRHRT
jgi:hypothetical protein